MVKIKIGNKQFKGTIKKIALESETPLNFVKELNKDPFKKVYIKRNNTQEKVFLKDLPYLIKPFVKNIKEKKEAINDALRGSGAIKHTDLSRLNLNQLNFTGTIKYEVYYRFSDIHVYLGTLSLQLNNIPNDLIKEALLDNAAQVYIGLEPDLSKFKFEKVRIVKIDNFKGDVKLKNFKLLDYNSIKINLFTQELQTNNSGHCVKEYLHKKINLGKKIIKKHFPTDEGISSEQILEIAKIYDFQMNSYGLDGENIQTYQPEQVNPKYQSANFAIFNNHLYPITRGFKFKLNKLKYNDQEIIFLNDFEERLDDIMKKETPDAFKISGKELMAFEYKNKIYVKDADYIKYVNVQKEMELKKLVSEYNKKISFGYKFTNNFVGVSRILANTIFPKSLFPYKYTMRPITEKNINDYNINDLVTIDKNKAYLNAIYNLKYFIVCDIMAKPPKKYDNEEIQEDNIYLVNPHNKSLWFPDKNYYTGWIIKKAREYHFNDFIIEEYLERVNMNFRPFCNCSLATPDCKHNKNPVKNLYDNYCSKIKDEKIKKYIINCMIGMLHPLELRQKVKGSKLKKIVSLAERKDECIPLTRNFWAKLETTKHINTKYENCAPIAIQTSDAYRFNIIQTMIDIGIKDDEIVQIKTDSITFIKNKNHKLMRFTDKITGWKKEEFKELIQPLFIYKEEVKSFFDIIKPNNMLVDSYAGCGKTYAIVNNLIPKLNKPKLDNFIVICPTHKSLEGYIKKNINCSIITSYCYNRDLPTEKNIIVDEYGMVDKQGHLMLFRCMLEDKNVYLYGDYRQLKPVEIPAYKYNYHEYAKIFLPKHQYLNINYRNKFPISYYDKILNGELDQTQEVMKHSTKKPEDASLILVATNKTRHKYNAYMCDKLNIKNIFDVGARIIIKTNEIEKFYNKQLLTIKKCEDNDVYFHETPHTIEKDLMIRMYNRKERGIDFGYAMTIHSFQGDELESYYWAEDAERSISPTEAYVIISRIKCLHGQTKMTDFL